MAKISKKCTVLMLTTFVAWKLGKMIIGGMVAGPCGALAGGFL
jgi:hypothetical protein